MSEATQAVRPNNTRMSPDVPVDDQFGTVLSTMYVRSTSGAFIPAGAFDGYSFFNYSGVSPATISVDGLLFSIAVAADPLQPCNVQIGGGQSILVPATTTFEFTIPVEYLGTMRNPVVSISGSVDSYFLGVLREV